MREIVFEINGDRYEAVVDEIPVRRSELARGQMTVEHSSESYAIFIEALDKYRAGEYVARPILD